MGKLISLAFLLASASLASAADITLTLNDQEQAALRGFMDSALKQGGLQYVDAVAYFLHKMQAAQKPPPQEQPH